MRQQQPQTLQQQAATSPVDCMVSIALTFTAFDASLKSLCQVAPIPEDIQDRRVEITGPVDRKMVINALNSGANVYMADFEDSNAPTWCAPVLVPLVSTCYRWRCLLGAQSGFLMQACPINSQWRSALTLIASLMP